MFWFCSFSVGAAQNDSFCYQGDEPVRPGYERVWSTKNLVRVGVSCSSPQKLVFSFWFLFKHKNAVPLKRHTQAQYTCQDYNAAQIRERLQDDRNFGSQETTTPSVRRYLFTWTLKLASQIGVWPTNTLACFAFVKSSSLHVEPAESESGLAGN